MGAGGVRMEAGFGTSSASAGRPGLAFPGTWRTARTPAQPVCREGQRHTTTGSAILPGTHAPNQRVCREGQRPWRRRDDVRRLSFALLLACGLCVLPTAHAHAAVTLPQAVQGFRLTHQARVYGPSNLEDHIDGQAESVKRYAFLSDTYGEYAPGGRGAQLITVDVFQMSTPLDAYGYYSFQLSPSARLVKFVPIGAEGYQTHDGLNFWKGEYYVNITITAANAPGSFQAALPAFGRAIASRLHGSSQPPAMLKLLPPGAIAHSQQYQRVDIAGQAFLQNGVSAIYPQAGPQAEIFICSYRSPSAARTAYNEYLSYLGKPFTAAAGAHVQMLKGIGQSAAALKSRFAGQEVVALKGRYVAGARKARDPAAAQRLVRQAVNRL